MREDFEKIINYLSQLPLSVLDNAIPGVFQFLVDMDESPSTPDLAKAMVTIKGSSIFEDREIRDAVFEIEQLPKINTWARNRQCSDALQKLGLSENFLPTQTCIVVPKNHYQEHLMVALVKSHSDS